jgi:hypothetical protein
MQIVSLCHTARARDLRTQKTVRVDGGGMPWDGRDPHEKSMLPTHIPSGLFQYQIRRRPCRGCVLCSRSPLDKCSKSNLEQIVPIFWSWASDFSLGKGRTDHTRGATHRENGMGRRMSEVTKVAPWPRLPEGTVADHPHQCRAWTGPGMRCRCRVCIRTLSVCAELSCTHIRALRVQGRSRQRRPAGRPGAKRLVAAVHGSAVSALGRDPGVSQKPQLSFGDGLHGCSAASKTTRPGP